VKKSWHKLGRRVRSVHCTKWDEFSDLRKGQGHWQGYGRSARNAAGSCY